MAEYSLPPQLQQGAPDVAQKFLSGVQLGASIGEAKNRLAQSQQQFAVEAQQKQDQITASALKEAQELAVSKAYNDQQISLKQQALEIADKKVGAETIKAARQFQAQQAYQKDFQDLVSTGMSEDDAAKSAMFRNLGMFGTGAGGGAAAMRAVTGQRKYEAPQVMKGPGGENVFWSPSTPHFQIGKAPASVPDAASFQASPLTDTTGKALPGKYTVPGPGGTRRVITTSAKNPNAEAIKSLEGGQYGLWLTTGKDPKTQTPEYKAAKAQYQQLKSGAASPATDTTTGAAPAAAGERVKVRSPDGSTGSIPKSQLDDAIDAGYEQVE
jgi:hypothetical protein